MPITLDGHATMVPGGSTLAELVQREHLAPAPGNLVSVTGETLQAGAYPGHIVVNGRPAAVNQPLREHDRVVVENGRNHREPVTVETRDDPLGEPDDPEYMLGRAPGTLELTVGTISGDVLKTDFHPTAPAVRPRAVALTFDDGPWPGSTRAILRILVRHHVPATFFLIGDQATRDHALVKAELAAGMLVEDHSWDHPLSPPLAEDSTRKIHDEITFTSTVETRLGAHVTLFRPPGGSWSDAMVKTARGLGMRVILWSVDPRDWAPGATPSKIAHRVLSHVRPGSIVLMHDGGGDRSATVKALPRIIAGIRHRGLRLVQLEH